MARPSHVRDAVRDRLADPDRHGWTIDELQRELHEAGVPADYSSVFRSLVRLEEEGVAGRVDFGDGKTRYEAAGAHHEHVKCDRCGAVAVVPGCVVEDAAGSIERLTGFRLSQHRLVLVGICAGCQGHASHLH